jgi:hypothetical protein
MKFKYLIIFLIPLIFCTRREPTAPPVPFHQLTYGNSILHINGNHIIMEALDDASNPQLQELKWVDRNLELNDPIDWQFSRVEKNKRIYLLSLREWDYKNQLFWIVGR